MKEKVIVEKSEDYALMILDLWGRLEKSNVGNMISRQLLRSGTSIGSNVIESQGAESTADFIHKMHVAYKEALESGYWLRLIMRGGIMNEEQLLDIKEKTDELIKILTAIINTSKKKKVS